MSERHSRKSARNMLTKAGYKTGGHMKGAAKLIGEAVHEHEGALHKGEPKTRIRLCDGGMAHGGDVKSRADRKPRGVKAKKGTTVNVIIAGQQPQPTPVPVPKPVPIPVPANAGPGAGPMPMPPPGAGPMPDGPPPPMGLKTGGRAKSDSGRDKIKGLPDGQFKRGGRTKAPVPMDSGSGGAKGRLEKAKDYGAPV